MGPRHLGIGGFRFIVKLTLLPKHDPAMLLDIQLPSEYIFSWQEVPRDPAPRGKGIEPKHYKIYQLNLYSLGDGAEG